MSDLYTAMIVDDEAPMRAQLRARLAEAWPELSIVSEASDGIMALEQAQLHQPDIIFSISGCRVKWNGCGQSVGASVTDCFRHRLR